MGHFADAQQGDLRALMRQGIQRARCDGRNPVNLFQVGLLEKVQSDRINYKEYNEAGNASVCEYTSDDENDSAAYLPLHIPAIHFAMDSAAPVNW